MKQVFNIEGSKIISREKILDQIKQSMARLRQGRSKSQVNGIVKSFYLSNGVIGTKVLTSMREGVDSEKEKKLLVLIFGFSRGISSQYINLNLRTCPLSQPSLWKKY